MSGESPSRFRDSKERRQKEGRRTRCHPPRLQAPLQIVDISAALEKVRRLVAGAGTRRGSDVSGYAREAIVRHYTDVYDMLAVSAATRTDVLLGRHLPFLWVDVLPLGGIFVTQPAPCQTTSTS